MRNYKKTIAELAKDEIIEFRKMISSSDIKDNPIEILNRYGKTYCDYCEIQEILEKHYPKYYFRGSSFNPDSILETIEKSYIFNTDTAVYDFLERYCVPLPSDFDITFNEFRLVMGYDIDGQMSDELIKMELTTYLTKEFDFEPIEFEVGVDWHTEEISFKAIEWDTSDKYRVGFMTKEEENETN